MAGSIYLPILSSFNPSGVNNAKKSLGGLANAFDGVKRALGVASGSFVAFKAISETIDFGRSSIVAARDLERNLNALDSVFGNLAPKMEAFAANGVDMGLSQIQSAKASTFLGSVLKQAGFDMDVVAGQTQNLVGLASDLAVTYGYDVSEALSGMTALFRGEYDPIEKFGVAMKQSEVNAVLAANGQDKLTGAARRSAEQQARLALLYQRTQDAQGAFKDGAGTLFVEQQKLQAIFNNLQAEVGQALVPALVKVAEALQPLVKTLAPAITTLFTQFASVITILSTQLNNAQSGLYQFVSFMGELFKILVAVLPWILDNGLAVATFIATFKGITTVFPILQGLLVQLALLKMELAGGATMATLFGTSMAATLGPISLVAIGIAGITAGMVILAREMEKAKKANADWSTSYNQLKKEAETDPFRSLTASSLGYGIALQGAIDKQNTLANGPQKGNNSTFTASNYGVGAAGAVIGKAAKNPADDFQKTLDALLKNFQGTSAKTLAAGSAAGAAAGKSFFDGITDGVLKEKTKAKLGKLGLSADFITAVLGASDWEATAKKLGSSTAGALAKVQANWYKTAEGIAAHQAAVEKAKAEYEKLKDEFEAWEKNVKALNEALADNKKQFGALGKAANEIGQFEQEVVSAFENIESTIKQALDVKLITDASAGILREFAKTKSKALTDNAAERDALRQKREDAQALFRDVKSSILNLGNITNLVDKKTAQVSTTITKVIDGITVATTRTVEEVIGGSTIIDRFKETIENSKKFAEQLNQLRQLGLNSNLFNQIVEAGVEAGSATATEIINGGASAVAELNNLFSQLDTVGTAVAETTTAVMFNNGQMVAGGLIEGLLAEEAKLAATAQTLADAFITAFNARMAEFQVNMIAPVYTAPSIPEVVVPTPAEKIVAKKPATVVNNTIKVTAGVGTNGTQVGKQIIREVNAATKAGTGRLSAGMLTL
jgi:hypothetical protein